MNITQTFYDNLATTRREELTELFIANGCGNVEWLFPEVTGFYQPIIVARK